MPKQIKEWGLVVDLLPFRCEMEQHEKNFIDNLNEFLDPFSPFLDQQSEKQLNWLNKLYYVYVEGYDYDDDL